MACELATNGGIADNTFDLHQKTAIFRAAFERFFRRAKITAGREELTFKQYFDPHPYIKTPLPLGLSPCPGIWRRPTLRLHPNLHDHTTTEVWRAVQLTTKKQTGF